MNLNLARFIAALPYSYLTKETLPKLIALDRLQPVLVRCGGCRFTCAAQDVETLLGYVEKGGDYVRDISIPEPYWTEAITLKYSTPPAPVFVPLHDRFRETDCGGVFDGHTVTSDADPGL